MAAPSRAPRLGLVAGVLAALALAPTALAAPVRSTITIDIDLTTGVEEFTATGGVVCAHGFAVTDPFRFAGGGRQGRGVGTFHLVKTMTCDNGDWFLLQVNAAATPTSGGTIGGFVLKGGSAAYAKLQGGGQIVGQGTDVGLIDHYEGFFRN